MNKTVESNSCISFMYQYSSDFIDIFISLMQTCVFTNIVIKPKMHVKYQSMDSFFCINVQINGFLSLKNFLSYLFKLGLNY